MPDSTLALTVIVTKLTAGGDFQFSAQHPNGHLRFIFSLASADMATAAALTSGNSATFTYGQNVNKTDYPQSGSQPY